MRVAFNKVKLTPKNYLGKPLAGYSRKEACTGKLDDIYAYGMLISSDKGNDGEDYLLMISIDTLKLPLSIVEYIKRRLCSRFNNLKENYILVHATHTHASFDLTGEFYYPGGTLAFMKGVMFADNKSDKFIVWMVIQILLLTQKLFNELIPCKFSWMKEKFNPQIVLNRRWPKRELCPDLAIISFKRLDRDEIIGIIINYACHPTTLSYKNSKLSADYPGRIIERISELTDDSIRAIYFNGASGDINPITTSGKDYERIDQDKSLTYNQLGTYEHTTRIGYLIADRALKLAKSISNVRYSDSVEIEVYCEKVLIPKKDVKYFSRVWFLNKLKWIIKKYFLMKIAKFDKKYVNFPFFTEKRQLFKASVETVIQFVKFAANNKKLGMMTIPGELFDEIGQRLLNSSPTLKENTILIQNCQDWIGYLFPVEVYITEGGYEPFMCFSPLCGLYIEKESKKLLSLIQK